MKYYTTKEISDIFGLRVKTIQRLIRDRKIKAYKFGTSFRVAESDLKLYVESKRV